MSIPKLLDDWLPVALGLVMIGAGVANSFGHASVRESFVRWGYPAGFHRIAGGLEVMAGLFLLIPATSIAGAIASAVVLLAAVMTLIRHRDWAHLPGAAVLGAAALTIVIGQGSG